jgi:hypothetical protein
MQQSGRAADMPNLQFLNQGCCVSRSGQYDAQQMPLISDMMLVRRRTGARSLRLDIGRTNDFAPFLRFIGDELGEIGR